MSEYVDISNGWSFNEHGDLELTRDYGQSISNRLLCPNDFLNIYYEEYGSGLVSCLGERFDRETVRFYLEKALEQDSQIVSFEIVDIYPVDEGIRADLIINGVELNVNLGLNPDDNNGSGSGLEYVNPLTELEEE